MNINKTRLPRGLTLLRKRANLFYILAFAPLLYFLYYHLFSAVIPFYGFMLLFLKHQKLLGVKEANSIQKILGSIIVAGSFFVYYGVVLVFPGAPFYTAANYVVYLLGIFLLFFEFSALKEAFAPLFLIVAATSSSFISAWLKPFLSPFTNDFGYIVVNVLRAVGIDAHVYSGNVTVVIFSSLSGKTISAGFVYECIGVYSALVFSIILVVILFEDPSTLKVKVAYSVAGIFGTFALNILRVTIIFLADYFYGAEVGAFVHYVIGYILFTIWLMFFLYAYSKRKTVQARITSFYQRIRST
ncbi:archaeosortase/exosortase family protein [Candidatus Bathyarchaeota archaeon]|nr:archaeosortase/exosortase family protein [Candidatus Bathyarchaeota archaeon]